MAIKRAGLGKGLGALITENTTYDEKNSVIEVNSVEKTQEDLDQNKKNVDRAYIEPTAFEETRETSYSAPITESPQNKQVTSTFTPVYYSEKEDVLEIKDIVSESNKKEYETI